MTSKPTLMWKNNSCNGGTCPTLLDAGDQYEIVGTDLTESMSNATRAHVGAGETAISVPKDLIDRKAAEAIRDALPELSSDQLARLDTALNLDSAIQR